MQLLHHRLADRVARDPSAPFLTQYAAGHRTELSVRSFANWVAKTSNLLEADLNPGDRIRLAVADRHPDHWMTLVWTMAAWQSGMVITDQAAEMIVIGPEPELMASTPAPAGVPTYACSLHPLGLKLPNLPAGYVDYSSTALSEPDAWFGNGPESPNDPALDIDGAHLTQADLVDEARFPGSSIRQGLVGESTQLLAIRRQLVEPILGGGSTVFVARGPDPDEIERILTSEKAVS